MIHRDSDMAEKIKVLCEEARRQEVVRIKNNGLADRYPEVAKIAKAMSERPANDIFISPWLIIIAERGGLPQRSGDLPGVYYGKYVAEGYRDGSCLPGVFRHQRYFQYRRAKRPFGWTWARSTPLTPAKIGYPKNPIAERREHPKPVRSIKYFR